MRTLEIEKINIIIIIKYRYRETPAKNSGRNQGNTNGTYEAPNKAS